MSGSSLTYGEFMSGSSLTYGEFMSGSSLTYGCQLGEPDLFEVLAGLRIAIGQVFIDVVAGLGLGDAVVDDVGRVAAGEGGVRHGLGVERPAVTARLEVAGLGVGELV